MNREEWKRSSGALRELLNKLPDTHPREGGRIRHCRYKFGALYNRRYRFWHIYNSESKNVIATVRFRRGRILVRYRPNSFYRYILQSPTFKNHQDARVIVYPTNKLFRHMEWIAINIHDQVVANRQKEEAARERDFLESQRQTLRATSRSGQGLSGTSQAWEQEYSLSNLTTSSSSSLPTELQQVEQRVLNDYHQRRINEMQEQLRGQPLRDSSVMSGNTFNDRSIEEAVHRLRHDRPDIQRVEVRRSVDNMSVEIRGYNEEGGYMTIPMMPEVELRSNHVAPNPYAESAVESAYDLRQEYMERMRETIVNRMPEPIFRPREEDA